MTNLSSKIGLFRLATITSYNPSSGIITITLDDSPQANIPRIYKIPIQSAWLGSNGEFIGGYPTRGSTIVVSQGQGGQWYIVSHLKSNNTFNSQFATDDSTTMSALKPGRALLQVKGGQRLFIDPYLGTQVGSALNFMHINAKRKIISHNFNAEMTFTEASRKIDGVVRRDILENANRNILGSTLDSQSYEDSIYTIPMDPSSASSLMSSGNQVRNPPLIEKRELVYEFANSYGFDTYQNEDAKYQSPTAKTSRPITSRRQMRTDALSLSLEFPNHLIEKIEGTAVDTFGNILDINRTILPIGQVKALSLRKSSDTSEAFKKILAELRKSIAYHFEINTRKGTSNPDIISPPDVDSTADYARDRSRFFIDIDKEGQFKINVPASSEIGNIPLLTRSENFSVLYSKSGSGTDPNEFVKEQNKKEIFVENFAGNPSISLTGSGDDLDGYAAPIDRFTDKPIKLGTAFHDITDTCSEFQEISEWNQAGVPLVNFDKTNPLNSTMKPLKQVVSNNLIVSGPDANAGGRSGTINMDGMLTMNLGANTVDRQSLFLDTAGGMVSRIGRDKGGISWASSFDGDVLLQIGGASIGNSFDSRFANENDAYKNGSLDIRVLMNGQLFIIHAGRRSDGSSGLDLVSPGDINISSQQNVVLKSNSTIKLEAPNIMFHAGSTKRIISKFPDNSL
jgi:hypothetical protein